MLKTRSPHQLSEKHSYTPSGMNYGSHNALGYKSMYNVATIELVNQTRDLSVSDF